MTNALVVPIHVDALYLPNDQAVLAPFADFSRLPYFNGHYDVNSNTPYISDVLLSQPFQDEQLWLKAGVHLHWALPDTLTRATEKLGELSFPAVPNRWLITRRTGTVVDQQFVIESDYLHPPDTPLVGGVTFPVPTTEENQIPFRHLGRKLPLVSWRANAANAQYLERLTAVGYGEPSFAALYSNCYSVFGFLDEDISQPPVGRQYDILGWYNNLSQDVIQQWAQTFQETPTSQEIQQALEADFAWTLTTPTALPTRVLCYTRVTFAAPTPKVAKQPIRLSIGNTPTEALSAHLAQIEQVRQTDPLAIVEDRIEAAVLSAQIEEDIPLDIQAKFLQARHLVGFQAVESGTLWTIRMSTPDGQSANANQGDVGLQFELPLALAQQVEQVNLLQQQYDRGVNYINGMRHQLFADWYKYMVSAYPPEGIRDNFPDMDEILFFIREKDLQPLTQWQTLVGTLTRKRNASGELVLDVGSSAAKSWAAQLKNALDKLQTAVNKANQPLQSQKIRLTLQSMAAPRFWQTNEPTVLMTGDEVIPTRRHGQDGHLREDGFLLCQAINTPDFNTGSDLDGITEAVAALFDETSPAVGTWNQNPWHPFLLEWEVEYFPLKKGSNIASASGHYDEDFITTNYELKAGAVDLKGKSVPRLVKAANLYSGRSILTPVAGRQMMHQLQLFLEKRLLPDFYAAHNTPLAERTPQFFKQHRNKILTWYEQVSTADPRLLTVIRAFRVVVEEGVQNLAQALTGLNEALLMRHQTFQLPIDDPNGFDPYRKFSRDWVAAAVGGQNVSAPQPLNDFNPIRAGALRLLRLRLIDTFGQHRDLDTSQLTTVTPMLLDNHPNWVLLPPRLAQPLRLNFRWLSAITGLEEMNDLPVTSPICGWLLPNWFDGSLMVYDRLGSAIGNINHQGILEPPPGQNQVAVMAETTLAAVIRFLTSQTDTFFDAFVNILEKSLAAIEPRNTTRDTGFSLLVGRPIAIARVKIGFQLLENPAIHQGWDAFRLDMTRNTREDADFTAVKIPIRIGDAKRLRDGVIGYWLETNDSLGTTFYAEQQDITPQTGLQMATPLVQSLSASEQTLTLLIDPRADIHATCGVVPVKTLQIPPAHYSSVMAALEVAFRVAPILTNLDQIALPLPAEVDARWSWWERQETGWLAVATQGLTQKDLFTATFPQEGETIWQTLSAIQWITPLANDPTRASVTRTDERTTPLPDTLQPYAVPINLLLDRSYLIPPDAQANLTTTSQIRSGWLKLQRKAEK